VLQYVLVRTVGADDFQEFVTHASLPALMGCTNGGMPQR
jgi:hypothetical protein